MILLPLKEAKAKNSIQYSYLQNTSFALSKTTINAKTNIDTKSSEFKS